MRTIGYIIQKEFIQLFRNKIMVRIIFMMPIIQLFILAYATTFEIKDIRLVVVDQDNTPLSRDLTAHFRGSPFYTLVDETYSYALAERLIILGKADQVITFPEGLERDLVNGTGPSVQVVTNAIDGSSASLMNAYSMGIIRDYNLDALQANGKTVKPPIKTTFSYWYNPEMNYLNYMVPGILVLLVTLIGMLLSGMNLVREKEIGTIEQINVTPIRKIQFIVGKLLPYWIVALFELAFGLTVAKLAFNIPFEGSLWVIFSAAAIYLFVVQGFGLMISTVTATQQQSMFLSWFFMVIFILMSGLFTPVDSMPGWAQKVNLANPLAYFIELMRMILLKGSGFRDIWPSLSALAVFAATVFLLAVWRYRKVS